MSKIEVNTVDVQCGSTLTLGSSGKTVTLAPGAAQSGFGRTGTVDWCTTAKTSPFTAVSGDGFFINTTGGAITVTLPSSPSAGDIVAFKDYAGTWDSNNVTVGRGGSKINGACECATLKIEAQSVTLIYVDGTKGWQDIHDSTSNVTGGSFVAATGGTETTSPCGNYKIHTFTASGCFQVTDAGSASGSNKISYVVVAGGGGAAGNGSTYDGSGAGGAGGFREGKCSSDPYTASPLAATPCSALTASVATFPISIGAGGAGGTSNACGVVGSNSIFSTITSTGGGKGAKATVVGGNGGSGGGGGAGGANAGGSGNTPPVSPPQGNNGGAGIASSNSAGGGGGGATAVGVAGSPNCGGNGGAGATSSINSSAVARSGGGGGGTYNSPATSGGTGGTGGGGDAGRTPGNPGNNGEAGTANTGGGGGAGATPGPASNGGAGGSGVVILRYKFQ